MSRSAAFLFPGQGTQSIGMGQDFADAFSIARETFEEADERLSYHLSRLIADGLEKELMATKNSQVAIYVTSIAVWRVIVQQFPSLIPSVCSGLSLGEYTAMTAAGSLDWRDGLPLVRARGLFMEEASLSCPGTMAVVLGMDLLAIQAAIKEHCDKRVWVANLNCPDQVVISGEKKGIDKIGKVLKSRGAKRVLPLAVSGAFHSGLMAGAKEKLAPLIGNVALKEGTAAIVMNVPGDYVTELDKRRQFLIEQVVSPVYWEKGVHAMEKRGVELFVEMGCGTTLSGMNRKMGLNAATICVEKVRDLEKLAKALEGVKDEETSCV